MRRRRLFQDDDLVEEPLVNLTPLIDVVFVVLISFMLISPILDIDSIQLAHGNQSKKQESLPTETAPLTVFVHPDNTVWMQGKRLSIEQLETTLRTQKNMFPGKVPQVIHDKTASFGTYQSVKNVFERCGFEQIDIVLKPG